MSIDKKQIVVRQTETGYEVDAMTQSLIQASEYLLSNDRTFRENLYNEEFAKSFDTKIKQLEEHGYDTEAKKMRQLVFELMDSMSYEDNYSNTQIDSEGHIAIEGDQYGQHCTILRRVAQSIVPSMVTSRRHNQLQSFCKVGNDEDNGFRITCVDPDKKVSKKEKKDMMKYSDMFVNDLLWSYGSNDRGMSTVLSAGYEDIFVLNRLTFLIHRNQNDDIIALVMIDPALVRELKKRKFDNMRFDYKEFQQMLESGAVVPATKETNIDDYDYAIYNDMTMNTNNRILVKSKNIIHAKFWHTNDYKRIGYVNSILEQAYDLVTMSAQALAYNKGQINPSTAPRGFVNIEGGNEIIGQLSVTKFKQALWSYIKNPQTNSRIPILTTPTGAGAKFINLHPSNKDAQYFEWMALIHSYICTFTGDDPNALYLATNKGVMEGRTLQQEGLDGATRRSNQLGRDTYLEWFVQVINKNDIIPQLTGHEDWKLEVTGLVSQNAKIEQELEQGAFALYLSQNEIRVSKDLEELNIEEFPWANVPGFGNQNIANAYSMQLQQKQQEEQQQQQQEMGGMQDENGNYGNSEDAEDMENESQFSDPGENEEQPEEKATDGPGLYDNFVFSNDEKANESDNTKPPEDENEEVQKSLIIDVEVN